VEMMQSEPHSFWGIISSHGNHFACLETACCLCQGSWSSTSLRFLPHGLMERIP
uniref:Uncharacterized protein n=1 Tax=Aotus nancymaae TaxID=37293 RepID=A0A2K5D1T2_AOTNA